MTPPVSPVRLAPWRRFFPTYWRSKAFFKREINVLFGAYRSSSAEAFLTNFFPNYTSAAGWAAQLSPSPMRSDWLSYYYAICYSPLVAKNAGFLAAKKELKSCFKLFCLDIFDQLVGFY